MPDVSPISMQKNGFVHPGRAAFFAGRAGLFLVPDKLTDRSTKAYYTLHINSIEWIVE
jgi:hypothetical protein